MNLTNLRSETIQQDGWSTRSAHCSWHFRIEAANRIRSILIEMKVSHLLCVLALAGSVAADSEVMSASELMSMCSQQADSRYFRVVPASSGFNFGSENLVDEGVIAVESPVGKCC
jgi:hypothetical protein